jgi:flavin-dependent dehydrogenase
VRPSPSEHSADVLVIGGGPAGAAAAAVLAERGRTVIVLEKSRHPRFHIGESLLPANLPIFERLGIAAQVRAVGLPKWGVEFHSPSHDHAQSFRFADSWRKDQPHSYEVRRSELDEILIRRAAQLGAQVLEGCRAREVELLPDAVRVEAEREDGERIAYRASYLIDASGRDTFLANCLGTKRRNRRHNSCAIYAHFSGAWRHEDPHRAGDISIFWFEHGWLWYIPLADGVTSVGAVVWPYYMKRRSRPLPEYFLETLALCPPLAKRLEQAQLVTAVEATGNYAYRCARASGRRFLLTGDAYTFIDPVFSSGVYFAMMTGCAAAETLDECLRAGKRRARGFRRFERLSRHGPKAFSWFIYRMTHPAMRDLFMAPRNVLRMKEALLSLLAGDIYGTTPIWPSLRAFRVVYYINMLAHPRRSLKAVRARVRNIRPVEPERAAAGG